MATHVLPYQKDLAHTPSARKLVVRFDAVKKFRIARPRLVISIFVLLVGLIFPFLMLSEIIPASLFTGFLAFALTMSGGIMALFYWGDF